MIEIINSEGRTAFLDKDTAIVVERNNPLISSSETFLEDVTYSFDMPDNPPNRIFLKNGHLVEAKNSVYELSVQSFFLGEFLYTGVLRYSYQNKKFKALLMVNFGAVAEKAKTVRITDIYTFDGFYGAVTAAYMKTVCSNPGAYPYSFFPVYNDGWQSDPAPQMNPMINPWDHVAQNFSSDIGSTGRNQVLTCPFWKAKHIIVKVMKYLGFECSGSWMDDPESDHIYIYTRQTLILIYDSVLTLPKDMKIIDFLNILRKRFSISFSFNLFTGTVNIQSAKSILSSTDVVNISNYITSIQEIAPAESKGYTVTLKPDTADDLFLDPVNPSAENHIPTSRLVVGDGSTPIELEASTLKSKTISNYAMPATKQPVGFSFVDEIGEFPIRFIYYAGMKQLPDGKIFPEAKPMELVEDDAIFYQFMNDSKVVKLTALVPLSLLPALDSSKKIVFDSEEYFHSEALNEKLTFTLKNGNTKLVSITMLCRTLLSTIDSQSYIETISTPLDEDRIRPKVTAFFDKDTGLSQIKLQLYYANITDEDTGAPVASRTHDGLIKKSTDAFGVGGTVMSFPSAIITRQSTKELRVLSGKPKYAILGGQTLPVNQRDGYYYFFISTSADARPLWLVF